MLAVTAGASLLVVWVATKALFVFLQEPRSHENRLAKECPRVESATGASFASQGCYDRLQLTAKIQRGNVMRKMKAPI
jgi:hypothetical protein